MVEVQNQYLPRLVMSKNIPPIQLHIIWPCKPSTQLKKYLSYNFILDFRLTNIPQLGITEL